MEVANGLSSPVEGGSVPLISPKESKSTIDIFLLEKATEKDKRDKADARIDDLYKSLTITAREVIAKLNELLKEELPDGIESLKAEDVTPEATADRIVKQVTAFFDIFARQHPELEGEELVGAFMTEIRSGVERGYNDAFQSLEDLGAFQFDGVQAGVEETKRLIGEKLDQYEKQKRIELGIDPAPVEEEVSDVARSAVLREGGYAVSTSA